MLLKRKFDFLQFIHKERSFNLYVFHPKSGLQYLNRKESKTEKETNFLSSSARGMDKDPKYTKRKKEKKNKKRGSGIKKGREHNKTKEENQ